MKNDRSARFLLCLPLLAGLTLSLWAVEVRKTKKYTEWTESEVGQILSHSPWVNTEAVRADISVSNDVPSSKVPAGVRAGRQPDQNTSGNSKDLWSCSAGNVGSSRQPEQDTSTLSYTVMWYSATPVRQAIARRASLRNLATEEQLKQFLQPVGDVCLIAVSGDIQQLLMQANQADVLKRTYLQVRGKDKIFATNFKSPSSASLPAIYEFPRNIQGAPIFTENDKDVVFSSDLGTIRIESCFIPKKMIFEDKLVF